MRVFDVLARAMGSALSRFGVLLVDIVSPGLWAGRSFRVYHEFTTTSVIRFEAVADFALDSQLLNLTEGAVRLEIVTGGTEGGVFTAIPGHFNKNLLGTPATPTFIIGVGGTHTGGTEREVLNASSLKDSSVSTSSQGKRLLPAGIYYMRLTVTGTTAGLWAVEYDVL